MFPARRRRGVKLRKKKISLPLLIILIIIAAAAVGAVVGNLLADRADEYERKKALTVNVPEREIIYANAPIINAYSTLPGAGTSAVEGSYALSVRLRTEDGALTYYSKTEAELSFGSCGTVDLASYVTGMHEAGFYLSGCFSSTWQKYENSGVRAVRRAYEISLLSEAAQTGINELVIIGLDVTGDTADEATGFIREVKENTTGCAIGVALPYRTVEMTEKGVYLAANIRSVCDFLLLDLRVSNIGSDNDGQPYTPSTLLDACHYDIVHFSMRLLLDKTTQSIIPSAAERKINNWQIWG